MKPTGTQCAAEACTVHIPPIGLAGVRDLKKGAGERRLALAGPRRTEDFGEGWRQGGSGPKAAMISGLPEVARVSQA